MFVDIIDLAANLNTRRAPGRFRPGALFDPARFMRGRGFFRPYCDVRRVNLIEIALPPAPVASCTLV